MRFTDRTQKEPAIGVSPFDFEQAHFEILDESHITADFQVSWQSPAKPLQVLICPTLTANLAIFTC